MKIETYISGMERCLEYIGDDISIYKTVRCKRQYRTFRDRIVRMDKEKDEEIARQIAKKEEWKEAYSNLSLYRE
jgi:hypothetical protein